MPGSDWNTYIRSMFGSISGRYDLMNTLMTFGMDRLWRRLTLEMACLPPGGLLLDVGAGTGKIAREALRRDPAARVVAADLTLDMMKTGRRTVGGRAWWCNADALALPFPEDSFDAATSGFLMRNVPDMRGAFQEQFRVVKPGGKIVLADFSPRGFQIIARAHRDEGRTHPREFYDFRALARTLRKRGLATRLRKGANQEVLIGRLPAAAA